MIGKVLRGTRADRLLYYLYGPGKANEHTDPHLVAGFRDPAELEPPRRPDGSRDFRRLTGLLAQPLAALKGPGYDEPVWHCSVRAAPGDRRLSDAEWAQAAEDIMHRTGLAPRGDDTGVRWVAVRHADDHVHIVATLARQDGARPRTWNDFYRVREACQAAEERYGLRLTAPADRTAAKRPSRAETEQAARRGWDEPPRVALRRHVCAAAAGARSEQEFFDRLADAGVLARKRYSTIRPGEVTGYAVGLPQHASRGGRGHLVWRRKARGGPDLAEAAPPLVRSRRGARQGARVVRSGGARRAARRRHHGSRTSGQRAGFLHPPARGRPGGAAAVQRSQSWPGHRLRGHPARPPRPRRAAVVVQRRAAFRRSSPCPGCAASGKRNTRRRGTFRRRRGAIRNVPVHRRGAGRDLRARGAPGGDSGGTHPALRSARSGRRSRCRVGSRRRSSFRGGGAGQPGAAPRGRRLRPSRPRTYGRIPDSTRDGERLRTAARSMSLISMSSGGVTLVSVALLANLVALAAAVAELRHAQQHAAQAAAARATAEHLHAAVTSARPPVPQAQAQAPGRARPASAADLARRDMPSAWPGSPVPATPGLPGRQVPSPPAPKRAGPSR